MRGAGGVGGCRVTRSGRCSGLLLGPACVAGGLIGVGCCWLVGLEGVDQAEECCELLVVGEDAPAHASAGGDDLAGDLDERLAEGSELHGEEAPALFVVSFGPAGGDW